MPSIQFWLMSCQNQVVYITLNLDSGHIIATPINEKEQQVSMRLCLIELRIKSIL